MIMEDFLHQREIITDNYLTCNKRYRTERFRGLPVTLEYTLT
jgi:hypothetical protein